jgi:membrane protein implicated in regulation of membrane protease activity
MMYSTAVILYVFMLSTLVSWSLQNTSSAILLISILLALYWRARMARLELHQTSRLEFEEVPEPVVMSLGIERD